MLKAGVPALRRGRGAGARGASLEAPALARDAYSLDELSTSSCGPTAAARGRRAQAPAPLHLRRLHDRADGRATPTTGRRARSRSSPRIPRSCSRPCASSGSSRGANVNYPRGPRVARRLRVAALRRDRRGHELGQVPRRRAPAATAQWRTVVDRAEITRLGEGLDAAGELRRGADGADGRGDRGHGRRGPAATASRRSPQSARPACGSRPTRAAFLAAVRERCGVEVEVIPGEEEARLAYRAAAAGLGPVGRVARRLRHRRRQLAVHLRRTASSVDEQFSVERRRGAVHGAVRPRRGGLGGDAGARRSPRSPPTSRASTAGRRPTRSSAWAAPSRTSPRSSTGCREYDPEVVQGTVLDRAEVDRQLELYRTRARRGAARDPRPAAEARRRDPRRRLHRAHRPRQARAATR